MDLNLKSAFIMVIPYVRSSHIHPYHLSIRKQSGQLYSREAIAATHVQHPLRIAMSMKSLKPIS